MTLVFALPAWAGGVALVLSEGVPAHAEFANALDEALQGSNWAILHGASPDTPAADLAVTVGAEALQKTLARGDGPPIVATLVSRQSYEKLLAEHRRPAGRITAIYLDQPVGRLAAFVRHLLPSQKRHGILYSAETRSHATPFRQAFNQAGLTLDSEDADTGAALLPALNSLLPRVGALIAQPDSTIYQRANIKPILISAFRLQRPVIAYSPAFVQAGALAALHTTPGQFAQQTADLIVSRGTALPPPAAPTQFSISINRNVAQALNINLPDEGSIRRAIVADRDSR